MRRRREEGGGRGPVRLEQREDARMLRGVSSLDGLLVLKRTR